MRTEQVQFVVQRDKLIHKRVLDSAGHAFGRSSIAQGSCRVEKNLREHPFSSLGFMPDGGSFEFGGPPEEKEKGRLTILL